MGAVGPPREPWVRARYDAAGVVLGSWTTVKIKGRMSQCSLIGSFNDMKGQGETGPFSM